MHSFCCAVPQLPTPLWSGTSHVHIRSLVQYHNTQHHCGQVHHMHLFCSAVPQHPTPLWSGTPQAFILWRSTTKPITIVVRYTTFILFVVQYHNTQHPGGHLQHMYLFSGTVPQYHTPLSSGTPHAFFSAVPQHPTLLQAVAPHGFILWCSTTTPNIILVRYTTCTPSAVQ